jgi:hypothetical protein
MAKSDDLLSSGPPAGAGGSRPSPLGVPESYTPAAGPSPVEKYREGDQYLPQGASREEIARMQARLDQAGLFDAEAKYRLGFWDQESADAYARLLKYSNRSGADADTTLRQVSQFGLPDDEVEAGTGGRRAGVSGRARSAVSLTHPDDIRNVADRTARQMLGRKLTDDELNRMVGAFHAAQYGSGSATGDVTTAPPSLETFAETQVEAADPAAAASHRYLEGFERLTKALGPMVDTPTLGPGGGVT